MSGSHVWEGCADQNKRTRRQTGNTHGTITATALHRIASENICMFDIMQCTTCILYLAKMLCFCLSVCQQNPSSRRQNWMKFFEWMVYVIVLYRYIENIEISIRYRYIDRIVSYRRQKYRNFRYIAISNFDISFCRNFIHLFNSNASAVVGKS